MAEIKIIYSGASKGQAGPRPQRVKLNETCRVTCDQPGALTIDFIGPSPLREGRSMKRDTDFIVIKPGRFKFKCTLTPPGGRPLTLGDPQDPNSGIGGEIEVGTETDRN